MSPFARLDQESVSMFISESLVQCLRLSRIAPFPLPALAKCSLSKLWLFRCIAMDLPIPRSRLYFEHYQNTMVFIESSRYRIQFEIRRRTRTCRSWPHEFGSDRHHNRRRSIRHVHSQRCSKKFLYESIYRAILLLARFFLALFLIESIPSLRITELFLILSITIVASSLLISWGSASESSSKPWGASVRRALQSHPLPYAEKMLYRPTTV